jgi:hypothetical protein
MLTLRYLEISLQFQLFPYFQNFLCVCGGMATECATQPQENKKMVAKSPQQSHCFDSPSVNSIKNKFHLEIEHGAGKSPCQILTTMTELVICGGDLVFSLWLPPICNRGLSEFW